MDTQIVETIAALDLEPIKVKLMHRASGEGWSLARANATEFEYRRFLILMKKFPAEQTAPLVDVDTFWHYHILDTMKYAADCEQVFGYFLHHFPYVGLRGEDDAALHARVGARMRQLYEATFGEDYVRAASDEPDSAFSVSVPNDAAAGSAFSVSVPTSAAAGTAFSVSVPTGPAAGQAAFSVSVPNPVSRQALAAINSARLSSFDSLRPRLNK